MVPELEKPRVTEIQVRMDCNGCVQKIKKALHGINGIYDLYIDYPQQKLTIIGWADPERIVKAIKKTRKIATICSHTEIADPAAAQPTEPPPEGGAAAPGAANPPPPEAPHAEQGPPAEPPKDPPPPENPPPEVTPTPAAADSNAGQPPHTSGPKDVGEVHVIYHHPPEYAYRYGYSHNYPAVQAFPQPSSSRPPAYVSHCYNTYKPSPYVTEYEYIPSPPRHTQYSRMENYNEYNYRSYNNNGNANGNGNITSMFSDENPNACSIA